MIKAAMQSDKRSFVYGQKTIDYSLIYCNRKTMEIAVHPDTTVMVKAPIDSNISLIEKKISRRARWIIRQLNYFKQFSPKTPERFYVSGETHLYLGRQYRLKITEGSNNSIKLSQGFFRITCRDIPTPEIVKKLLNSWYSEKASVQFKESMERCWHKFNSFASTRPTILIRRMRKRWGSLSDKGTVTLNTDLVRAPKECIDYVVTHELCHLKYHNHSTSFYKLLCSITPNWEKTKNRLELSMV